MKLSPGSVFLGTAATAVIAAIVAGLFVLGSPSEERARRIDDRRVADLKGIMAAKRIPIDEKNVNLTADKIEILEINYPPEKPPGKIVGEGSEAVPELIRLLRQEAKVIS